MKNIRFPTTITVSGGVGTVTTSTFLSMEDSSGKIVRLVIIPPNEGFSYDLYVLNPSSERIYERKGRVGTWIADREIDTIEGTHTIGLEKAKDGIYALRLTFKGEW